MARPPFHSTPSARDSNYPLMSLCLRRAPLLPLERGFSRRVVTTLLWRSHLLHDIVPQSSEARASIHLQEYSQTLKEPLPTVTSPVFSEIVLCSTKKACFGHCRETCVARDLWNHTVSRGILFEDIRGVEGTRYRSLGKDDAEEAAKGSLDFHPWVPSTG